MSAVEARLTAVEARLADLESKVGKGGGSANGGSTNGSGKDVASDSVLDGQWGDPVIKLRSDPKSWAEAGGESYIGCKMSECPSGYLDALAGLFDWQAGKDEEAGKTYTNKNGKEVPTAPLKRSDAAKARGWSARNKGKVAQPAPALPAGGGGGSSQDFGDYGSSAADDEIPFVLDATTHGRWDRP